MTRTSAQPTDLWLLEAGDIREGDIVLCSRPSPMQYFAELIGDFARHVGIVVGTDTGLMLASVSRKSGHCQTPVVELTDRYSRVSVVRLQNEEQAGALAGWMCESRKTQVQYSLVALSVAFLLSWARDRPSLLMHKIAARLARGYALVAATRGMDRSYVCSTIVTEALWQATSVPLQFPLTSGKHAGSALAGDAAAEAVLLTRFLCTPSDILRYASKVERGEVSGCNAVAHVG